MTIYESDLPGVGKKFEIELEGDQRLVIVTHNTGKREVFLKSTEGADSEKLFELSDRLARTVGTILEGAYFQPVESERIGTMLSDETFIEWYNAGAEGELIGQTLTEANVRDRTGVAVIAIQRGEDVLAPPDPNEAIATGDTLVVVGSREDCAAFEELLSADEG